MKSDRSRAEWALRAVTEPAEPNAHAASLDIILTRKQNRVMLAPMLKYGLLRIGIAFFSVNVRGLSDEHCIIICVNYTM